MNDAIRNEGTVITARQGVDSGSHAAGVAGRPADIDSTVVSIDIASDCITTARAENHEYIFSPHGQHSSSQELAYRRPSSQDQSMTARNDNREQQTAVSEEQPISQLQRTSTGEITHSLPSARSSSTDPPQTQDAAAPSQTRTQRDIRLLARWLRFLAIAERLHAIMSSLFKLAGAVISIYVLARYWSTSDHCRAPLKEWILLNLIAGLVHYVCKLVSNFRLRRGLSVPSLLSLVFTVTQILWGVWIFIGFLLTVSATSCRKSSPALYDCTAVLSTILLFGSQLYHVLILCLMISPAANTLRQLAVESTAEGHRAASEAEIEKLGTVAWTRDTFSESADGACAICLVDYSADDMLRVLPCRDKVKEDEEIVEVTGDGARKGHHFHAGCIDQWLVRQAVCPICKQDIDPMRRPHGNEDGGEAGYLDRWGSESEAVSAGGLDVDVGESGTSGTNGRAGRATREGDIGDSDGISGQRQVGWEGGVGRSASDPFPRLGRSVEEVILGLLYSSPPRVAAAEEEEEEGEEEAGQVSTRRIAEGEGADGGAVVGGVAAMVAVAVRDIESGSMALGSEADGRR